MTKTLFTFLLTIFFFGSAYSQDTAAIVKSAKIIPATEAAKKSAEQKIQTLIGNSNYADSLYSGFLFWIGPRLWDQLKDFPEFKNMHLGNLAFSIPEYNKKGKETGTVPVYGKLIQSKENYQNFWSYVWSAYNVKGASIVPMNDRDKYIYWSYYNNIEEPIVVIKSDKGRLLLKFNKGTLLFVELTN